VDDKASPKLSERDWWAVDRALRENEPVDEALLPAAIAHHRQVQRNGLWILVVGTLAGTAVGGPGAAWALADGWEDLIGVLPLALALSFVSSFVAIGGAGAAVYGFAVRRERRLLAQSGEHRSIGALAQAAQLVGPVLLALLATPWVSLVLFAPVQVLLIILELVGVPIDPFDGVLRLVLGTAFSVGAFVMSHRWIRRDLE
jgi:hypothetical protein